MNTKSNNAAPLGRVSRLVRRLLRVWNSPYAPPVNCLNQREINRLRKVLHEIADSRPDAHMDIEKNPELVNWICDTCHKASVGAYPSNVKSAGTGQQMEG
jgi:hypothetical protein